MMDFGVPEDVRRGIERVRESGYTNMFDRHAVAYFASAMGEFATVIWVYENPEAYYAFLARGREPDPV